MKLPFQFLCLFFITLTSYGQEAVYASTDVKDIPSNLSSVPMAFNQNYTSAVESLNLSNQILMFRNYVANHSRSIVADISNAEREWSFENNLDQILVNYDSNGAVIRSQETYRSIKLPNDLRAQIIRQYPGWHISGSQCSIHYDAEKTTKVKFRINLKKGELSETVNITKHLSND